MGSTPGLSLSRASTVVANRSAIPPSVSPLRITWYRFAVDTAGDKLFAELDRVVTCAVDVPAPEESERSVERTTRATAVTASRKTTGARYRAILPADP